MKSNFFEAQHRAEDPDNISENYDVASRPSNLNLRPSSAIPNEAPPSVPSSDSHIGIEHLPEGATSTTSAAAPVEPRNNAPASKRASASAVTHVSSVLGRPKRNSGSAVVGQMSTAVGTIPKGESSSNTFSPGMTPGADTTAATLGSVTNQTLGPTSASNLKNMDSSSAPENIAGTMPLSLRAAAMKGGYMGSAMLGTFLNKQGTVDVNYNEIVHALGLSETTDERKRKEVANTALMRVLEQSSGTANHFSFFDESGTTSTAAGTSHQPPESRTLMNATSAVPAPTMATTSALLSQQIYEAQLYVQQIQQFEALRAQLAELRASGEQQEQGTTTNTGTSGEQFASSATKQIQTQMTKLDMKKILSSKDAPSTCPPAAWSSDPPDGTPASLLGFHGKGLTEEIAHLADRTANLRQLDEDLRERRYSPEDAHKNVVANKILEDRDRVAKLLLQARDVFGQTERESLYAKSVVERLRLTKTLMEEFDETQELHRPGNLQSICSALHTTLEDYDVLTGSVDRVGRQALIKLHENMKKALQNESVHMAMMEARQLRDQQQTLQARSRQTKLKTLAQQAREAQMRYLTCKTAWKQMTKMRT
ncbi:unnamed protein product [Amoebophrya sp. A25]|nr:unnamed protein product [Amoebophrya sp. A25]|eukprot:GSA25T00013867001.1